MIATVTKKYVKIANLPPLTAGQEVTVHNDIGSTKQVEYRDPEGNIHIAYNVNATWLADVVVYRRAKDLGYE